MRSTGRTVLSRKVLRTGYLILLTFTLAHLINGLVADALYLPDMSSSQPPLALDSAAPQLVPSQQLAQHVLASGLFPLPSEPRGAGASSRADVGPPLEAAKKLALLGTVLAGNGADLAILQDQSNQQQKAYRLHDHVPNVGELAAIEKDRVLFLERGQEEWLELKVLASLRESQRMPALPDGSIMRPVSQISPSKRPPLPIRVRTPIAEKNLDLAAPKTIDRRELSQTLSDIPQLLLQAQAVPSFIDGRFNGLQLEAVRFTGFFHKIGLQSGDILKRINGVELRDPGMLISMLQQMKEENTIKLDLIRNEERRTFTYQVR